MAWTSKCKEVKCTDPSPSVRIPWQASGVTFIQETFQPQLQTFEIYLINDQRMRECELRKHKK